MFLELVYHVLDYVAALLIETLRFKQFIQELYLGFVTGYWVFAVVVGCEKVLGVLVSELLSVLRLRLFVEAGIAYHRQQNHNKHDAIVEELCQKIINIC